MKRLPTVPLQESHNAAAEAILDQLRKSRSPLESTGVRERKRLAVEPGKSLSVSDISVIAGSSTSQNEEEELEEHEADKSLDGTENENVSSEMVSDSVLLPRPPTTTDFTTCTKQWVVVKFATKKNIKHFIGRVKKIISCDEIEVRFLKMTREKSYVFSWPGTEDVSDVKCDDIVGVLNEPISLRRGVLQFKEHLHSLM